MTPTWLPALVAIGGFLAFVYFSADLAVQLRGPRRVPRAVLRLARSGNSRMEKASPLVVAETAGAALFFVAVPAFWLLMRRDELESSGMFLLAGGLIASIAWGVILWTVSGRK